MKILDLMKLTNGHAGLKELGGRINALTLCDLPFDPDKPLPEQDIPKVQKYLANDLALTEQLLQRLAPDIELRHRLEEIYGLELESDGAPTVAEKILISEYCKKTGADRRPLQADAKRNSTQQHRYTAPSWFQPLTAELRAIADLYTKDPFDVEGGEIQNPVKAEVRLGTRWYTVGMGGLHSIDGPGLWRPSAKQRLVDADVTSYYPSIILACEYAPRHLQAEIFLDIYRGIRDRRLVAKRDGETTEADGLKLVLNSTFGKTNYPNSLLFDPAVHINVVVTGQLGLLLLIERLEEGA